MRQWTIAYNDKSYPVYAEINKNHEMVARSEMTYFNTGTIFSVCSPDGKVISYRKLDSDIEEVNRHRF